jgi:hypothetical protein
VAFAILKSVKANGGAKMDVQVKSRLSKKQLIQIAAYIKSDSSQYNSLQVDFLLPGNNYKNTGGVSVYAIAAYHDKGAVTPVDTVEDADKNLLSFEFIGFTPEKAKLMLAFKPDEITGNTIMGKFIDDNTKTVSIIYEDKSDNNQIHILELDTLGKAVAAIVPMEIAGKGVKKLVISQQGDYCVLKDSLLIMYSSDAPDKPYRSIHEGL